MPGYTAYAGLLKIGEPKRGETIVIAAASGPVGATVGQIAKIKGCRVVGIAGGAEKCAHVVEKLGFDTCINHQSEDFAAQLATACSDGIDVYFEIVGGKVLYAVLPLLNPFARVPVCGAISWYNQREPDKRFRSRFTDHGHSVADESKDAGVHHLPKLPDVASTRN